MSRRSRLPSQITPFRMITRSMKRMYLCPSLIIQRAWRRWVKRRGKIDPITLTQVIPPVFVHVSDDCTETYFSAAQLVAFIEQSGDYRNPLTRVEFNTVEIMRLVRLTGNESILNVARLKNIRQSRIEQESLRAFFDDEIDTAIATFVDYISDNRHLTAGHMVRHMMALVFPTIIVTVARVQRNDSEYVDDLFGIIDQRVDEMENITHSVHVRTAVMIFRHFVRDIRTQVDSGSLLNGRSAQIDVGGMLIRIDLSQL